MKNLNNIKNYDLFGVNLTFVYLKKEKHGSLFGFFLSLLLLTILFAKLSLYLKKIITKEDIDSKMQEFPLDDDIIQLSNFSISICPSFDNFLNETKLDDFMNISLKMSDRKNYTKNLEVTKKISNEEEIKCLKIYGFNQNLTCKKNTLKDISMSLYVDIDLDLIKRNYNKDKDKDNEDDTDMDEITTFTIFFEKTYVNASDYYNYYSSYLNYMSLNATQGKSFEIKQNVEKLSVEFVDDLFSFGLFEPYKTTFDNYTHADREILIYDISDSSKTRLIIEFRHSRNKKLYTIITFSMENLLSQFGGYIQIISFIFFYIGETYNHWNLRKNIKNRLKDIQSENDKVYKKMDNFICDKSGSECLNLERSIIKPNSLTNNLPSNNNMNIEMNELNNNGDLSKISINIKKKEIPTKNLTSNDPEELTQDFYSLFDYEYLYTLIKEIKLLKFVLLSDRHREYIELAKKIPINIEKFEKNKIDTNLDNKDNSIDYKLQMLKNIL